jgi:hypothetical protein
VRSSSTRKRAVADASDEGESGLLKRLGWRMRDVVGATVAVVAAGAILVNVLFLQSGRHPAPLFTGTSAPVAAASPPAAVPLPMPRPHLIEPAPVRIAPPAAVPAPSRPPAAAPASPPAAVPAPPRPLAAVPAPASPPPAKQQAALPHARTVPVHNDPIGEFLAPSRHIVAVQRALTQFGYGQINPTGTVDADTQAAIVKFERAHKMPVTGQVTDRLARELGKMADHSLD